MRGLGGFWQGWAMYSYDQAYGSNYNASAGGIGSGSPAAPGRSSQRGFGRFWREGEAACQPLRGTIRTFCPKALFRSVLARSGEGRARGWRRAGEGRARGRRGPDNLRVPLAICGALSRELTDCMKNSWRLVAFPGRLTLTLFFFFPEYY
jgi:hypothetical protein